MLRRSIGSSIHFNLFVSKDMGDSIPSALLNCIIQISLSRATIHHSNNEQLHSILQAQ